MKIEDSMMRALWASCEKWFLVYDRKITDIGAANCALCKYSKERSKKLGYWNYCGACPVHIKAGSTNCGNTPYEIWRDLQEMNVGNWKADTPELRQVALEEYQFLVDLTFEYVEKYRSNRVLV